MAWLRFAALAFAFHLTWEMAQMPFYRGIRDAAWWSTLPTCSRAALFDVAVSLALVAPFLHVLRRRAAAWWPWAAMMVAGAVIGLLVEQAGVRAGRWAYAKRMPLLPWLDVGLMPILQMSLIPYLSARLSLRPRRARNADGTLGKHR